MYDTHVLFNKRGWIPGLHLGCSRTIGRAESGAVGRPGWRRCFPSTLEAPIDSRDHATKIDAVHNGIVTSWLGARHPEANGSLEGADGIVRDDPGIVDSIEPDGLSDHLVVVVP